MKLDNNNDNAKEASLVSTRIMKSELVKNWKFDWKLYWSSKCIKFMALHHQNNKFTLNWITRKQYS